MPRTATLDTRPKPEQIKPAIADNDEQHAPAGPGDNVPFEDILFFAGQMRKAKEGIKAAQKHNKLVRRSAKGRGIEVGMLDEVMKIADEDDETEIERLRLKKHYCQALNLPVGSQFDLFDGPGSVAAKQSLEEKAYQDGYHRGVMGLNPDEQAYPPTFPEGQEHINGYNAGQKVLHDKFIALNEEIAQGKAAN